MSRKVEFQPAWLLHSRPYRDTSALLDFHTRDFGRLTLLAKGLRRPGSRLRGLLQPFTPLQVSWSGRSSLKTLVAAESSNLPLSLKGEALFSAFYVNELYCRLLHEHEGDEALFDLYGKTLQALEKNEIEPVLRSFELDLLEFLGYGISFDFDSASGEDIDESVSYLLDAESGFIELKTDIEGFICKGSQIRALAVRDFSDMQVRRFAKQLNRIRLSLLLGDKPLKSRRLFTAVQGTGVQS